jgi:hypothetical protein
MGAYNILNSKRILVAAAYDLLAKVLYALANDYPTIVCLFVYNTGGFQLYNCYYFHNRLCGLENKRAPI